METGKNILVQNLAEIKKRVADIPMVEEASVRRVFPNKIKIWIKERIPAAYIYTGNQCAVVDVNGKILDVLADRRVEQLVAGNTPVKETAAPDAGQTPEASSTPGETGKPNASAPPAGSAKPSASPSPSAVPKPTGSAGLLMRRRDLRSLRRAVSPLAHTSPKTRRGHRRMAQRRPCPMRCRWWWAGTHQAGARKDCGQQRAGQAGQGA